jgi:hypothetical protein
MHSTCSRLAGILALVAATAAAPHAHAQAAEPRGFLVGVGGGVSLVNEPAVDASHFGAALNLRAGWRLGPSAAVMLEATMNAHGSRAADSVQVIAPGGPYFEHFSRSLQTESLLASVQLGSPASFYVRPGVGIARHGFRVLRPLGNDMIIEAMEWEIAPAAALTVGRGIPIPGFPLNLEGVVGWSGGEDSTNPRWTAGVQIARVFQF